jgi:hypothetical protein
VDGEDDDWQPLDGALLGANADALYEGVPAWLVSSLREWVKPKLKWQKRSGQNRYGATFTTRYDTAVMHQMELRLHTYLDWSTSDAAVLSVLNKAVQEPDTLLGAVDLLLHQQNWDKNRSNIERLEDILRLGSSAWMVNDDDNPRLVRRVDATYEAEAKSAMERGKAGKLIRAAWVGAYGREPNASHAYQQAVRAVEAAAQPIILPDNDTATLGQIIPAIKQAKQVVDAH